MKQMVKAVRLSNGRKKNLILNLVFGVLCGLFLIGPEVGLTADIIIFQDVNPDFSQHPELGGSGGRVNGLASVPGNNQVFYAATEWGGLYKTNDAGKRWFRLDGHLPAVTWDVEVNPAAPLIVYATSFYDGRVETLAGINVSWDGGITWQHPATATPPPTFNCDPQGQEPVRREEPSAFGISIDPHNPNNVYIGFICGLAVSNDLGRTWRFVDPEQSLNPDPTRQAATIVDVVAHSDEQGNHVIDVCGTEGHFRSLDGGRTWKAGTGLPSGIIGICSIAVSPDESYVLLAVVGTTIFQTVDAEHWVPQGNNPGRQGRIPFVTTNKRSKEGDQDIFDLWFGDIFLHRFRCTTPTDPEKRKPGEGDPRCPADPFPVEFADRGAHRDAGDLAFDSEATNDACPLIFSSDGGVYRNTMTSSTECHDPFWTQPNVSPHALWFWTLAGAHQPGQIEEDLYFGTQDNGPWLTTRAGGLPNTTDWTNLQAVDSLSFAVTPRNVAHHWQLGPTITMLGRAFTDGDGEPNINFGSPDNFGNPDKPPLGLSGTPVGFRFPDVIDEWGEQNFALVTVDSNRGAGGLFITENRGFSWGELGNNNNEPAAMCAIRAAFSGRVPVFYVQVGSCDTRIGDQLWRFIGTDANGRWQQIHLPDELQGAGISLFAVDRSNADRLYASLITPGREPRMIFSRDGGETWRSDRVSDRFMQGHGVFRYQTRLGPHQSAVPFLDFTGYPQPSLLAFDPQDRNLIIAGGHDSGVFLSRTGGQHWELVTDPFDPVDSGVPHLTSPRFAYFDHDSLDAINVYIGTVGRGVWRMRIPR